MKRLPLGCTLAALVLGSMPAAAQKSDAAYCAELSSLYRRYLGNTAQGRNFPDVSASVAMDECQKGNTAAGIPVLEKKLRDARFTLPSRN
ncbi:hypothetical protein [Reyranella sp.]|uniref:hypothetical protein n=1 Tax=Reyranella sp. TaxID=1929291 RepID=UPI003BAA8D5C